MGCCSTRDQYKQVFFRQKASKQVYKSLINSDFLHETIYHAIDVAEKTNNRPVYLLEVYQTLKSPTFKTVDINQADDRLTDQNESKEQCLGISDISMEVVHRVIQDLYRADQILGDIELNRFSVNQRNQSTLYFKTEFQLCSDRFDEIYPSYQVDDRDRVTSGPYTPTHNFD